ncbi:Holliday junction resolvase RuvX [Puniceicoccaceae bacterium K14]|nr:Holliday junction resolvase RuvX [Puniceicoccaceae bacterium K14]
MRCIGIDWGERRIGLSYGDEIGVATPLPAIIIDDKTARLAELVKQVERKRITDIVIGYPYNMNGSIGFKAKEVDAFIEELSKLVTVPIHRIDERLTSHEVKQYLGNKRDDELRRSGKIDSASATLILQDYLSQNVSLPEYDPYGDDEDWEDES